MTHSMPAYRGGGGNDGGGGGVQRTAEMAGGPRDVSVGFVDLIPRGSEYRTAVGGEKKLLQTRSTCSGEQAERALPLSYS